MLILFAVGNRVPIIAVIIMIWRDTIVDGLRMSASAKGKVVAAGMPGKIKTVLQMFAIIFVMLYDLPFAYLGIPMDQIFIWGATIASVYSGIVYFMKLKDVVMEIDVDGTGNNSSIFRGFAERKKTDNWQL